jgi:hypothetical protein
MDPTAMRERMQPSGMPEKMQAELDQSLESAGVDLETREALAADLEQAFEEQFASGSPPDPAAMKEIVDGIFEKYGLNAEDFVPQGGPPGGGMGAMRSGAMGRGQLFGQLDSADTSETSLLETLLEYIAERSESGETDTNTTPGDLSQQVLDILFGIDEQA